MRKDHTRRARSQPTARGASRWADDTGAMPLAVLVTLVGVMLSTVLVSTVSAQTTATQVQAQRIAALHAAQSGIDVGWARLGNVASRTELPCGPLSGSVFPQPTSGSVPGDATFNLLLDYFDTDPKLLTEPQLAQPAPANNKIGCTVGSGPNSTPAFALLRSTGRDASGRTRTLRASYTFRIKHLNVAGGLILLDSPAGYCLDAGSDTPPVDADLTAKPCNTDVPKRQKFAYNNDLTLSLPSSKITGRPTGLCLTTIGGLNTRVKLKVCAAPGSAAQKWGYKNYNHFMERNNLCLGVGTGNYIVLLDDCQDQPKWRPESAVGAGAAGPATDQLVNFEQFGRCLDLDKKELNLTRVKPATVQAYPCFQGLPGETFSWNQQWDFPALPSGTTPVQGTLRVTPADGPRDDPDNYDRHCLTTTATAGGFPYLTPCPGSTSDAKAKWNYYGENASYRDKYTIVDIYGRCLAPKPLDESDPGAAQPVAVEVCDGSTLQKWNAPPYIKPGEPLKDISER